MKKFILTLGGLLLLLLPLTTNAATLSQQLSGRIVLQVQAHGEAWYVYPGNKLRYFLGRPADAFRIMRELGLGISEADYNRYKDAAPDRLLGRIMLRVQAHGEAYYVDPLDKKFTYLGRPADAFRIMREKGLGITNENLAHMPIAGASIIPPDGVMNIVVAAPHWNDLVSSPIAVSGQARVFENTLRVRVRNSNDKILADTQVIAQAPDAGEYGSFSLSLPFTAPGTDSGYLEAFTLSAKDGTEIDKVSVLLRFGGSAAADWKTATDSAGNSFLYPASLGTTYVQTVDWPPQLQLLNQAYSCLTAGTSTAPGGQTAAVAINGRAYCQTKEVEGAAGSIYTQYAFAFARDAKTAILTFTIREPQCVNYDDPQKTACENEENNFSINNTVDQMAQSLVLK